MDISSRINEFVIESNNDGLLSLLEYLKSPEFPSNYPLSEILNHRNKRKNCPLHEAIFKRNYTAFKALVDAGADVNAKCHGTPISHLLLTVAALPEGEEFGNDCLKLILETGNIIFDSKDDQGGSMVHIAAEYNNCTALKLIFSYADSAMITDLVNAKDRVSCYPLHRASLKNSVEAAKLLLVNGAKSTVKTTLGSTILHTALLSASENIWEYFSNNSSFETLLESRDVFNRTPIELAASLGYDVKALLSLRKLKTLSMDPTLTGIITDSACLNHHTCLPSESNTVSAPPENIHRLEVLIDSINGVLRSYDISSKVIHIGESKEAPISDILRVHEWPYLRRIQAKCETIAKNPNAEDGLGFIDGDTTVSNGSFKAALKAAGAVCTAVDMIMAGDIKNAFCPIRPPGHHAGPRGVVKGKPGGPDSHGFCLVNNISIGAAYAMNMYRDSIKKVAIVDFDVHHGNGTEETVRWLQPGIEEVEISNDIFFGKIQAPRYKPWHNFDDHNNVFFVSVHGYGPRESGLEYLMPRVAFYPGSGETVLPPIPTNNETSTESESKVDGQQESVNSFNDSEEHPENLDQSANDDDDENDEDFQDFGNDDGDEEESDEDIALPNGDDNVHGLRKVFKPPSATPLILDVGVGLPTETLSPAEYRHQWRNYFRNEIFPRLDAFGPDILFISAGFDAHKKDTINGGYIALIEEDFEWITTHLVRIANSHSKGRVVSALEGGYQLGGEYCSAFAKSVKTHVQAMCLGGSAKQLYSESDLQIEIQHERKLLDEAEAKRLLKEAQAAAAFQTVSDPIVESVIESEDFSGSRKRRRAQVDYTALDKELRAQAENI